jgi:hypothetical protein
MMWPAEIATEVGELVQVLQAGVLAGATRPR